MDALFSGIKDKKQKDDSDSSDDDNTPEKKELKPQEKPSEVADLLSFDSKPAQQQQQPADVLGDLLGSSSQPAPQVQGPPYRPLQIDTPSFGNLWGTTPYEKQIPINCPGINTTQDYSQMIQSKLGIFVIQVINNEVISSG